MPEYSYEPLGDEHIRLLRLYPAKDKAAALEGNLLVRKLRLNDKFTDVDPDVHTFTVTEEGELISATPDVRPPDTTSPDPADKAAQRVSAADPVPEAEPYEALSYTWGGKPDPARFIKILHGGQAYNIPITANLESALRHLRSPSDSSYLWIDALCIHQENHVEKGSQIPKMADIYNQAMRVRVWLGEETDNSAIALRFIRRVLNLGVLDQLVQDELTPTEWAAFLDLMKRPWFSRRWIVQEIALAREAYLHCGEDSVTWRDFAEAVSLFTSKHHDVRKLFQASKSFNNHPDFLGEIGELGANRLVYASGNLFRKSDDGTIMEHLLSLEALMSSLSVFEASNPHDIVYAVLWLANDATPSAEEPRGSSLNEPPVIHTPNPGSPSTMVDSPTTLFSPDLRTLRVPSEPPLNNADISEISEYPLSVDVSIERIPARAHSLQDFLTVPTDGQRKRKRAGSETSQALSQIRLHVKPAVDRKITVDYSKSVYEVCKDFLAFAIAQSQSLDMICRPWAPNPDSSKEHDLPSWIPKLSGAPFELVNKVYKRVEADPLVGSPGIGRKNYNASGKWKATGPFKDDVSRSLFVRGFVLDTVKVKMIRWDHGRGDAPDRFWRTLVADRRPDGRRPPHIYQSAFKYAFQSKGERGDLNTTELILYGNCPSMAIEFLRRVQSVVWKRSLILTQREDFLGLAPSKSREGDLVCILHGCSVPVVLRRIERASLNGIPKTPMPRASSIKELLPRTDSSKSDHHYKLANATYME